MAKEYIKRVDLENRLHALCAAQRITAQDAIDIAILPPADVRPVVRGRWIGETVWSDRGINVHAMRECNNCHKVRVVDNFCPNCGADMREVLDDD